MREWEGEGEGMSERGRREGGSNWGSYIGVKFHICLYLQAGLNFSVAIDHLLQLLHMRGVAMIT